MLPTRVPLWKRRGAVAFTHYWVSVRIHLRHHLFFDSIQFAAAPLIIWWWYRLPSPGYAIGVVALLAAVMSMQGDTRRWQKALWMLLIGAFVILEFRAIDKDRADAVLADGDRRTVENSRFFTILTGLLDSNQQSQKQFQETMSRLDATLNRVGDSIKTQTGGDSFAYVTFVPQPNQQFAVAITSRGRYPLHDIQVEMVDDERRSRIVEEYNKHPDGDWITAVQAGDSNFQVRYLRPQSPDAPSGDVQMLGRYPFGTSDSNDLTLMFSSLNGHWNERLHLRKINGQWHQSLSVIGPATKQWLHPFIYSDSDYPDGKALAEKDWQRIKPLPKRP